MSAAKRASEEPATVASVAPPQLVAREGRAGDAFASRSACGALRSGACRAPCTGPWPGVGSDQLRVSEDSLRKPPCPSTRGGS
jgi:hypothetical protein